MSTNMPITDRPIKMALVGCGRVGQYHYRAMQRHPDDYHIVAFVDEFPQAAEKMANGADIPVYPSLPEMIDKKSPDVVVLSTPSGLHAAQAIQAAKLGCHVVSEKPLATKVQDGLDMIRAADEAGTQLFVVKQNRYNPPIQALKKAIDAGRFGKIYMANLNVFWSRPQSYYDQAKWRGTWEFDGGALMNQACHYVDMLTWLFGPVDTVQAMSATMARKIQAEDSIVMNVAWRNGALGSLNVTTLTREIDFEGSITIIGEKGTVRIGGIAMNKILVWDFADAQAEDDKITDLNYETGSVYGFGHDVFYDRLKPTLRGTQPADVTGRDAFNALEIIIAAYRSARDGKAVSLPLNL